MFQIILRSNLHATLIQWCQYVKMVLERMPESFPVIHEQNSIVPGFVVVPITVLNEEIENGYINQI